MSGMEGMETDTNQNVVAEDVEVDDILRIRALCLDDYRPTSLRRDLTGPVGRRELVSTENLSV